MIYLTIRLMFYDICVDSLSKLCYNNADGGAICIIKLPKS